MDIVWMCSSKSDVHTHLIEALNIFDFRQSEFLFSLFFLIRMAWLLTKCETSFTQLLLFTKFHLMITTANSSWTFFLIIGSPKGSRQSKQNAENNTLSFGRENSVGKIQVYFSNCCTSTTHVLTKRFKCFEFHSWSGDWQHSNWLSWRLLIRFL